MTTFNIGQTVKTVTGGTAEIYRIEEFGGSIFYECWVVEGGLSQGMKLVHETKLIG